MTREHTQQILLPGFIEHHSHFRAWAAQQHQLDLHSTTDIDGVLAQIEQRPEVFVRGHGLAEALLAPGEALAAAVDRAARGNPVVLTSRDQHALLTTPATLRSIGLQLDELAIPGGVIERDAHGTWTGVLREASAWHLRRALPADLSIEAHRAAVAIATRRGVTTLHDMDGLAALRDWATLHDADGGLDVRVVVHLLAGDLDSIDEARALEREGLLRIGGLKLFADGTLGSGTALLHEPELPLPGSPPREGVEIVGREDLIDHARRAAALGLPLLVHAIGDAAATNIVDALETTHELWRDLPASPRIEHAQLMRTEDIQRCAALGIALSVQPTMLVTDRDEADARWGSDRTARSYAYRSMHDAGCALLFGSDAPIEPLHPLAAIHAAIHRDGGAHDLPPARGPWHAEQCLPVDVAVAAATGWAAPITSDTQDAVELAGDDPSTWQVIGTRLGARWTYRTGR